MYGALVGIFTWVLETELGSLCMHNEHFVNWAISPVLTISFWSWKTGSLQSPSAVNGGSRSPDGFTDHFRDHYYTLIEVILTPLYETKGFAITTGLREEDLPSILETLGKKYTGSRLNQMGEQARDQYPRKLLLLESMQAIIRRFHQCADYQ